MPNNIDLWTEPRPKRFTLRQKFHRVHDTAMLVGLYRYGGMLTNHHITRLFYVPSVRRGKHPDNLDRRMSEDWRALWLWGYVDRTVQMRSFRAYWLTKKGATLVAQALQRPMRGENRIAWLRRPSFANLVHDVENMDAVLDLIESASQTRALELYQLIPELHLRHRSDKIGYVDHTGKWAERSYVPDSILDFLYRQKRHHIYCVERDRDTESCEKFAREKLTPFLKYVKSSKYRERFGVNMGRMLVIVPPYKQTHVINLKQTIERYIGAKARWILLTTRDQLTPTTGLTAPIWYQGGQSDERHLSILEASA